MANDIEFVPAGSPAPSKVMALGASGTCAIGVLFGDTRPGCSSDYGGEGGGRGGGSARRGGPKTKATLKLWIRAEDSHSRSRSETQTARARVGLGVMNGTVTSHDIKQGHQQESLMLDQPKIQGNF